MTLNAPARPQPRSTDGRRVTVRLSPETYAGVLLVKLQTGQTIEQVVEAACAQFIRSAHEEDNHDTA